MHSPWQITFQPIPVLIDGHDIKGVLVLADGQLAAVLSRLDGEAHTPDYRGRWHLEAGLGKCDVSPGHSPLWNAPEEAEGWVRQRLSLR